MDLIIKKIKEGTITIQELTNLVSNQNILTQRYEEIYILSYIYKYIFYNDNFNKKELLPILRTIKEYAKTNQLIATIAYENNNFTTAILNKDFLLDDEFITQYYFESEYGINKVITKLKEKNMLKALCDIPKIGKLLCWKSSELGNIMIIEYLCQNFNNEFSLTGISLIELLHVTDSGITLFEFLIINYPEMIQNLLNDLPKNSIDYEAITQMQNSFTNQQLPKRIKTNDEHKKDFLTKYEKKYFEKRINKEQAMDQISTEAIAALEEFKTIMNTGEESDSELIELGCLAFIEQFANNNSYAMSDLYSLINIKKQNPEFSIKIGEKSRFSPKSKTIYLSSIHNIDTFNHETTHAIHHYATDLNIPADFKLPYVFSNIQLEKIYQFAKKLNAKCKNLITTYKQENYQDELIHPPKEYYLDYLKQIKLDCTNAITNQIYPKNLIEYIAKNGISSKSEFITQYQKNEINEIAVTRTEIELNIYCAFEDIFDALSLGNFLTFGITINDNPKEQFIGGHGQAYFNDLFISKNSIFSEIISQYVTIIKSPQAKELINILIDIMGQEFVDILQNFYENMYIDSKSYTKGA